MKNKEIKAKVKLIYNPHAGQKRSLIPLKTQYSLEDIVGIFQQYQIPVDSFPSKSVEDAIELAKSSQKEGYEVVVAAGGDGTVATIAHGLVGTDVALAVLPMGSVMNIARMLAVPNDMEMAIALIKIGRVRKIDVAEITRIDGQKMEEKSYFLEQAGIGFDADLHYYLSGLFERGEYASILKLFKLFVFPLFGKRIEVEVDGKVIEKKARMVLVSNGPYSGPGLNFAPKSKLNDHKLMISIFHLNKLGLIKFLLNLILRRKAHTSKIKVIEGEKITIRSKEQKLVHADARIFGTTPVEFRSVPSSLNVVVGFPKAGSSTLNKRTPLDL